MISFAAEMASSSTGPDEETSQHAYLERSDRRVERPTCACKASRRVDQRRSTRLVPRSVPRDGRRVLCVARYVRSKVDRVDPLPAETAVAELGLRDRRSTESGVDLEECLDGIRSSDEIDRVPVKADVEKLRDREERLSVSQWPLLGRWADYSPDRAERVPAEVGTRDRSWSSGVVGDAS